MVQRIKYYVRKCIPRNAISVYGKFMAVRSQKQVERLIRNERKMHKDALIKLKNKETINCIFLALFDSVWKYDNLYQLMEKDERFFPIIVVCPIVNYGMDNMLVNMETSYKTFVDKGYRVIRSYDKEKNKYVDLRKELHPDILFYTNPYKGLIDNRYYIDNFTDILSVYVPYFISSNSDFHLSFNEPLHNLVWRRYLETDFHKKSAENHSMNKGCNAVVTGSPGIDNLINPNYHPQHVWLDDRHKRKRIIWAPHHTIKPAGVIYYSCFLEYAELFFSLANKYEESIEICFKPHPLLKNKLYSMWGKEKTDIYYDRWNKGANTFLSEGQYIDLFLTSDAMIHDSASFIVEYLYVNKPVLRTLNGQDLKIQFSTFGLSCLDCHYKADNEQDIEQFIKKVIDGVDPLKEKRTKFINEVLMPKEGIPSENILKDIIDSIEYQRV